MLSLFLILFLSLWAHIHCGTYNLFSYGDSSYGILGVDISLATNYIHDGKDLDKRSVYLENPLAITTPSGNVSAIASGGSTTFFIMDGDVYSTGKNNNGECALGIANKSIQTPQPIEFPGNDVKIEMVSPGYIHVLFLSKDGVPYSAGSNQENQCGFPSTVKSLRSPTRIPFRESVVSVNAGFYHSFLQTKKGRVYSFGSNDMFQLGLGHSDPVLELTAVNFPDDEVVKQISAGYYHSVFLTNKSSVYSVGFNGFGQTGVGTPFSHTKNLSRVSFRDTEVITQVAAGDHFTLFLNARGSVFGCGRATFGSLGIGELPNPIQRIPIEMQGLKNESVKRIDAGTRFSLLSTESGKLFQVGYLNVHDRARIPRALTWPNITQFAVGSSSIFFYSELSCGKGEYWNNTCIECPAGSYCMPERVFHDPIKCASGHSKPRSSSSSDCTADKNSDMWIWIGILLGVVSILIAFTFCVIFCSLCIIRFQIKRSRKMKVRQKLLQGLLAGYHQDQELDEMDREVNRAKLVVQRSLMEIDFSELRIQEKLGSGGSDSVVFRALWNENLQVAIKVFKFADFTGEHNFDAFERELSIISALRHPKLISFYGCCLKYPRIGFVMEYAAEGSIADLVRSEAVLNMSVFDIYLMLSEICEGMRFLHMKGVIHRDLKADNVLITENGSCKIADFGLSKHIENFNSSQLMTSSITGTSYYIAPEVTNQSGKYSFSCDVYSFGIMLFEILTGKMFPFPSEFTPLQAQMRSAFDPTFRPDISCLKNSRFSDLAHLCEWCWNHDPSKRPTFKDLFRYFAQSDDDDTKNIFIPDLSSSSWDAWNLDMDSRDL